MGCGSFSVQGRRGRRCFLPLFEEATLTPLCCSPLIRDQHIPQPQGSSSSSQGDSRHSITPITIKVHQHPLCQTTKTQDSQVEMPRRLPAIIMPILQSSNILVTSIPNSSIRLLEITSHQDSRLALRVTKSSRTRMPALQWTPCCLTSRTAKLGRVRTKLTAPVWKARIRTPRPLILEIPRVSKPRIFLETSNREGNPPFLQSSTQTPTERMDLTCFRGLR